MRGVLEGLESGNFTFHLILLIFLVFIATPILKRLLFKRARRGGAFLPPRKPEWTPAQVRQARRLLREQKLKQGAGETPGED